MFLYMHPLALSKESTFSFSTVFCDVQPLSIDGDNFASIQNKFNCRQVKHVLHPYHAVSNVVKGKFKFLNNRPGRGICLKSLKPPQGAATTLPVQIPWGFVSSQRPVAYQTYYSMNTVNIYIKADKNIQCMYIRVECGIFF